MSRFKRWLQARIEDSESIEDIEERKITLRRLNSALHEAQSFSDLVALSSGSATETKDVMGLTGYSFLGLTAEATNKAQTSSEMEHKSAMAVAQKVGGGMDNCQNCVYVLERIKQG